MLAKSLGRMGMTGALAAGLAAGAAAPAQAGDERGGLPELKRALQQEVADRKAADDELTAAQAALKAALEKAIQDGDAATLQATKAAIVALQLHLEKAIEDRAAAAAAAAQAANDALEAALLRLIEDGDLKTLDLSKSHAQELTRTLNDAIAAVGENLAAASSRLLPASCTADQVPKFDGQAWSCAAVAPTASRPTMKTVAVLSLEDEFAGRIGTFQGGGTAAEVIKSGSGEDKTVGPVGYEDLQLSVDLVDLPKRLRDWIADSLIQTHVRRNGAVHVLGTDSRATRTIEFFNGMLSEVRLPAVDNTSDTSAPCALAIRVRPELLRLKQLDPSSEKFSFPEPNGWKPCRVELKSPLGGDVLAVESLSAERNAASDIGDARGLELEPTRWELSNLVVTVPGDEAGPWLDWFETFVLQGHQGSDQEKDATLVYRTLDGAEMARVQLDNLGVVAVRAGSNGAYVFELYLEAISLDVPAERIP